MNSLRRILLTSINRFGQAIPKSLQRRIADFPGILKVFEKLSNSDLMEIPTPEGCSLVMNPLLHYSLVRSGGLSDYEPDMRKTILKFTRPGMVAYDIGANVGVFSFLFASIVGEDGMVYSFEPEENNYTCFEKSLEKHNKKNIVLDKRAVGRTKSTERFDRRGGAFSGRLIGNGLYDTTDNIKIVETVSIDYVVNEERYRVPDILKIDVEGNEGMVLEGMRNILETCHPIIICELHTHLGESTDQVTNLLTSYGYTISNIKDALTEDGISETVSNRPVERHIIAVKRQ
ncbi:FkbM family methyltransferase [bacterium]|nr:FkbM family methyltransferase [bacterium]